MIKIEDYLVFFLHQYLAVIIVLIILTW